MRHLDYDSILAAVRQPNTLAPYREKMEGRLTKIGSTLVRAHLPGVGLSEICYLPGGHPAEVVAIEDKQALLSPYREPFGLTTGMMVVPTGRRANLGVGEALLGRVLDALGQPVDGLPPPDVYEFRDSDSDPPDPMQRSIIKTALPMGVTAIDATLTVGIGQRLGVFAPAGCGKSTLLSMLAANSDADVIVMALIGERGREVREFLEQTMTPEIRARSVVVLATSDRPALERLKAAATATTVAEYFRDTGRNVLLLVDSLTRYARAVREIALAAGEPVVNGGYPPSLYARLPRLLERAGPAAKGSITAFYTVLMEEKGDPLAEEVRSLLDGHIILSRRLAEANHFPAIDVLSSLSRIMNQVTTAAHIKAAGKLRHLLATWQEIELLVRVGEYRAGQDPAADEAMARRDDINALLRQAVDKKALFDETLDVLSNAVGLS